jgi:hypothetical protein
MLGANNLPNMLGSAGSLHLAAKEGWLGVRVVTPRSIGNDHRPLGAPPSPSHLGRGWPSA